MSLSTELEAGGRVRLFFDAELPNHRSVQTAWRADIAGADFTEPQPETRLFGEIGLASGHLLAGKAVGKLGWGSGGVSIALVANINIAEELEQVLEAPFPDVDTAIRASWWAGLLDRLGRGFAKLHDPQLEPFRSASSLSEAMDSVPIGPIRDLTAILAANGQVLASLPPIRKPGPVPSGAADVGGADADLIAGTWVVELKTIIDRGLSREHLRQLVAYPLLDFDDEWGSTDVAMWSTRFSHVTSWNLDELLSIMAGRPTTVHEQRTALAAHLGGRPVSSVHRLF